MRLKTLALVLFFAAFTISARAANLEALARQAVAENADDARAAVAQLRAQGPAGLDALFQAHEGDIKKQLKAGAALYSNPNDAKWLRITAALDAVAQQKDSYAARLFWHTDLEQAKMVAKQTGKPILSLRLLGNLTDDFSCANSRFFRAALYPNEQVSAYLREHFVLHWSSERPVPRVTIDFGDGRKLETTITGNSIHYILDADGNPIDAIPGLYGPAAFLRALQDAEKLFRAAMALPATARLGFLRQQHTLRLRANTDAWVAELKRAGVEFKLPNAETAQPARPTAAAAAPLAVTKSAVEAPLVRQLNPEPDRIGRVLNDEAWQKVAALHLADAQLDDNSRAVMARQLPPLPVNRKLSPEGRLYAMVENFQKLIALDTARNEYLLHTRLHAWFADAPLSWETLNRRVYSELFLTPRADAWLGLYGADTYTGLDNGGVKQ